MTTSAAWPLSVRFYLVSFLVVGLAVGLLGPAITELRSRTGAGIGDIGVLFVGQSLGYIVGSMVGGRLYDRLRSHHVYAGALVVLAAAMLVVPSLDTVRALFVTFVVIGIGGSVCDLGGNTLLIWSMGASGGRAMNLLHLSFGIGALTAPLLVHLGVATATRVAAVVCIGLATWVVTIPSPSADSHGREEHTDATVRVLLALGVFFAVYVGVEVGFAGWVKTYGEEIHFGELAATWLTATFWAAFTLGRLLASIIADRVSPGALVGGSSAATVGAAAVLVVGGGSPAAAWVGTVLMGVSTAPQFAGMMNYAERRIHVTGAASMWFIGGAGLGGLVFPWVIGRWLDAKGATALPWAMVVFGLLAFVSFGGVVRVLARRPTRRAGW